MTPLSEPKNRALYCSLLPPFVYGSLFKIEFKEVQSYGGPVGRQVCAEWPPVIGVENAPGFEMSDRALDRGAQPVYLCIEFLLPVKQLPALRLLERCYEARALIALVADPAGGAASMISAASVSARAVMS